MKKQQSPRAARKWLGFLLMLVMAFSLTTVAAFADETQDAYIAKVGDTYCTTVSEFKTALTSASGDVTVDILNDIDMGSSYLTINSGQSVILNLNGKGIQSTYLHAIDVRGGNLTVNDTEGGKVIAAKRGMIIRNSTEVESEKSTIVINGGLFQGNNYGVYADSGCNVTINGGQFIATATNVGSYAYAAFRAFSPGDVVITGGEFTGETALRADYYHDDLYDEDGNLVKKAEYTNVYVKGGTFNGKVFHDRGKLEIYDGVFSTNVNDYCVEGVRPKTQADGTYVIKPYAEADPIATIGDTTYQTVQEAINDAKSRDTIKILEGEKERVTIPEGKDITIDLNASSLSTASDTAITNNGTLNLINSVEPAGEDDDSYWALIKTGKSYSDVAIVNNGTMTLGKNIYIAGYTNIYNYGDLECYATTYSGTYGVSMKEGSLTIKDGQLTGIESAIRIKGGTLTIEDGTVYSAYGYAIEAAGEDTVIQVNGGAIAGSLAGLYISNGKSFAMTDGEISSDEGPALLVKGGNVNISGGSIVSSSDYAVTAQNDEESEHEPASISIRGGKFWSDKEKTPIYAGGENDDEEFDGNISVYGGLYSARFDRSFLADGKHFALNSDDVTSEDYPYMVMTPLEAISLDQTSLALMEGDTAELTAEITPEDATSSKVTWSSSDESVATVEGGSVTAVSAGKTKIIAIDGEQVAFCTVTVSHDFVKTSGKKATSAADGTAVYWTCSKCGKYFSDEKGTNEIEEDSWIVPRINTVALNKAKAIYNGKVQTPQVIVKDAKGELLDSDTDYTVNYLGTFETVGAYNVLIQFKGNYAGSVTKRFVISPKTTSIRSVSRSSKAFTVKWKKQSLQTSGYQIRYSKYSSMKSAKKVSVTKTSTTSKKIRKLKANKKYYVQIRTYKKVNGTRYYSSWSSVKSVVTK